MGSPYHARPILRRFLRQAARLEFRHYRSAVLVKWRGRRVFWRRRGGHAGAKRPTGRHQEAAVAVATPCWRRVASTSVKEGVALRRYQGCTTQVTARPAWSSAAYHHTTSAKTK